MKAIAKIGCACMAGVLLSLWGCASGSAVDGTAQPQDSVVVTMEDSVGDDPSMEDQDVAPPQKSDAEISALTAQWKRAEELEKKFFGDPELTKAIAALDPVDYEMNDTAKTWLSLEKFKSLPVKSLVQYTVFHPEYSDQVCAEMAFEPGYHQAISLDMPFEFDYPSERQDQAIKSNADSVGSIVLDCIRTNQTVSVKLLQFVVNYQLKSVIPAMVEAYRAQATKDDLILTALVSMMVRGNYKPWLEDKQVTVEQKEWYSYIHRTPENADRIIFYAQKFAKS